ncbi:IS110 family transposase, partial [Achromobacter spanius]|uniref:IS110 family transposase n=1 Tax=Achromobacter spanius TaxID=217203 RepID=UPI0032087669
MDIVYQRCAGLDVHKQTVVACVRVVQGQELTQQIRTFKTHTAGLLELAQWLKSYGVREVAMEATGVYWKPPWHVLEEDFDLVLANAAHVKNVPGRKTDVNDAMWLADLLAHGLIQPSFVPPGPVQELRTLTRTRKQFVRDRSAQVQRLDKILEDANVKLSTVVSDLTGKSGRAVIQALIDGCNDPQQLLAHISPRVKASRQELLLALHGRVNAHHRFLLKLHLHQIDAIDQAIAQIDQEAGAEPEPFRHAVALLSTMPGLSEVSAQVLIAEIGLDMSRFASA